MPGIFVLGMLYVSSQHFCALSARMPPCCFGAVPINLNKIDADHDLLKAFHSILYGAVGKKTVRKKNIRRCQPPIPPYMPFEHAWYNVRNPLDP